MEIEVKARLADKDVVVRRLQELGCVLGEAKVQDDTVYVARTGDLDTFLSNDVFLRIRVQGERILLTAKKPVRKSPEELVKFESETIVDSLEGAQGILELFGLKPAVRLVKTRQEGECRGYGVCIDDIEGLGSFIELESIGSEQDAPRLQAEMHEFLAFLGIQTTDVVKKGYDILLLESQQA